MQCLCYLQTISTYLTLKLFSLANSSVLYVHTKLQSMLHKYVNQLNFKQCHVCLEYFLFNPTYFTPKIRSYLTNDRDVRLLIEIFGSDLLSFFSAVVHEMNFAKANAKSGLQTVLAVIHENRCNMSLFRGLKCDTVHNRNLILFILWYVGSFVHNNEVSPV